MPEPASDRPPVSVIVPFAGDGADAAAALGELEGLALRPGDELILADNSADGVVAAQGDVRVARAPRIGSSYYARNTGAEAASNEWLLFVDSDTLLPASLIDAYFETAPASATGLIAGEIAGDERQPGLIARYLRSRGHLGAEDPLGRGPTPAAGTANLLVRRRAWSELGGFAEVVSGADFEFAWRAGRAGWRVEFRPGARVGHRHPERLSGALAKARRYGAGQRWVERRFPGAARRPGLARELARAAAGILVWSAAIRFERAAFKGLDALWIANYWSGWWFGSNEPGPPAGPRPEQGR